MRNFLSFGLLSTLLACTPVPKVQLDDARFATGSRTMVASADANRLFAVNVDEGTISRVDIEARTLDTIEIGMDPTRIARAGNTYFVTLRGERAIGVFQDSGTGLERLDTIEVGCEPFGVVATEDGSKIYVTLSQESRTISIDVDTRAIENSWPTPGDPRWLALHPKGELLIVAPARSGVVYAVNTQESGEAAVEVVEMPITERTAANGIFQLRPRIMGDMAFDPTGTRLVIPVLYVDNKSQDDLPSNVDPTTLYYANPLPGIGRFNSAVVEVPVSAGGKVKPRRAQAIFLASFTDGGNTTIRSYPNSVTVSPDGLFYSVSLEGSDALVTLGALPYNRNTVDSIFISPGNELDPLRHGFVYRPHVTTDMHGGAAAGPRGVVYISDDQAMVHTFLDLKIRGINAQDAHDIVLERGKNGVDDTSAVGVTATNFTALEIERSILPVEVREGRELFYTARNDRLVSSGAGVSCNTCHVDGRDDGLNWQLGPDVWQTPSLAGRVSDTHPVTWDKQIESVAAEAEATSRIRMGGGNLLAADYALIGTYVDFTAEVDTPTRGLQNSQVEHGRTIFEREDVGCADCHNGVAFTDNQHYDMYDLIAVNTPPLRGIAATGPYLHDGRAATIRDVLDLSRAGMMGNTSNLSPVEMNALEAYVMSL